MYSQTPFKAYRPWTVFLSLKWGYPHNAVYHTVQNMTDVTRVVCVTTAIAASDHLLVARRAGTNTIGFAIYCILQYKYCIGVASNIA